MDALSELVLPPQIEVVPQRRLRPERSFGACLAFPRFLGGFDALNGDLELQVDQAVASLALRQRGQALLMLREIEARCVTRAAPLALCRCLSAIAEGHWQAEEIELAVENASRALAVLVGVSTEPHLQRLLSANEAYLRCTQGHKLVAEGRTADAASTFARARQALPDLRGNTHLLHWAPSTVAVFDSAVAVHTAAGALDDAHVAMAQWRGFLRHWQTPADLGLAWLRQAELRRTAGSTRQSVMCLRRAVALLDAQEYDPHRVWAQLALSAGLEALGDARGAYGALVRASKIEAVQTRRLVDVLMHTLTLDAPLRQAVRDAELALAQTERLSAVGHLVAGVNHELIQPMSSVKLLAETALEMFSAGQTADLGRDLQVMNSLCEQLVQLSDKLAGFPSLQQEASPQTPVAHAIEEALLSVGPRLARSACKLAHTATSGRVPHAVHVGKAQLVRVLINLLHNALDAMATTPQRRIDINVDSDHAYTTITVSDSGVGIDPAARARLFQPFYSTKPAGQGLGLGLALSRDELRLVGGDLWAMNSDSGAVFVVKLKNACEATT
jgi:C4-dicarboxylate-specific signal transduction histidine kinase